MPVSSGCVAMEGEALMVASWEVDEGTSEEDSSLSACMHKPLGCSYLVELGVDH